MTYGFILATHIFAAVATAAVVLAALYAVTKNKHTTYQPFALAIGFLAAFQISSGTVLAFLSPELSAAALALHIVAYLSVCGAVEALLFVKMKKLFLTFPLTLATSPILASLTLWISSVYLQY